MKEADLEATKSWLKRLHDASGHPSSTALARLLEQRGLPRWIVQLAVSYTHLTLPTICSV
eukprot:12084411-Alexandrium_andersonii.AAC.1